MWPRRRRVDTDYNEDFTDSSRSQYYHNDLIIIRKTFTVNPKYDYVRWGLGGDTKATQPTSQPPPQPDNTSRPPSPTPVMTHPKYNINKAKSYQLQTVPGIGPALATRILEYLRHHRVTDIADIARNVCGIGLIKQKALEQYFI